MSPHVDPLEAILDHDGDLTVRAGAGTGKTHTLVARYLAELERTGADGSYRGVRNLAALTFTERAAEEMRERIRLRLGERIAGLRPDGGGDPLSTAALGDEGEHRGLRVHLIAQRQLLSSAYVTTIHSFCARLLKERPVAAGIDPGFVIAPDDQAGELMERAARDAILSRLRGGDPGTARLLRIAGYTGGERGEGVRELLTGTIPLLRAASLTPKEVHERYVADCAADAAKAEGARQRVEKLMSRCREEKKSTKGHKFALLCDVDHALLDGDRTVAWGTALLEKADWLDPGKKRGDSPLNELHGELADALSDLAGPAVEAAAAADVAAFLALCRDTLDRYGEEKRRRSLVDFDDLQERAFRMLDGDPQVREAYRAQFARLLVDEYQDTNELQRRIVTLLAPPGSGRLMVVGDVKQSIYRFRGGDHTVFERTAGQIGGVEGGREFVLRTNRRSTPALVGFANGFFARLMGTRGVEEVSFETGRDDLLPHRDPGGPAPERFAPPVEGMKANDRRVAEALELARRIAHDVASGEPMVLDKERGEPRPLRHGDVALLCRKGTVFPVLEGALRYLGVPCRVVKGKGVLGSGEVADLMALLRWLDDPADRLSLFTALRSPLGGVSDPTLFELAQRKIDLADGVVPDGLADGDDTRIGRFIAMVQPLRRLKERRTVSELLEAILGASAYPAVTLAREGGEEKLSHLFRFVELARQFEADGRRGLASFIASVERRLSSPGADRESGPSGGDEVTIMTVHQSKGLEFPYVALCDLGGASRNETGLLLFDPHGGIALRYVDEATGVRHLPPRARAVRERVERAGEDEERRLLYVAMTRARDRLLLTGSSAGSGRKGLWQQWVDDTAALMGEAPFAPSPVVPPLPPAPVTDPGAETIRRLSADTGLIAAEADPPVPPPHRPTLSVAATRFALFAACPRRAWHAQVRGTPERENDDPEESRTAGMAGSAVHALLERLPLGEGPEGVAAFIAREGNRWLGSLPAADRDAAKRHLTAAVTAEPLAGILALPPERVEREWPFRLRYRDDRLTLTLTGAADLVVRHPDRTLLVDYKYARRRGDEPRYRWQLAVYAAALLALEPDRPVETGLLHLKESRPFTPLRTYAPDERGELRRTLLDAGALMTRLEGEPMERWPGPGGELACDARPDECPAAKWCGLGCGAAS